MAAGMSRQRIAALAAGAISGALGIVAVITGNGVVGLLAGLAGLAAALLGAWPGERGNAPAVSLPGNVVAIHRPPGASGGVKDQVTGLFNESYFLVAVETRVAAARRHLRPVAVVLLTVTRADNGQQADPGIVANAITSTLRDSDTACRLDNGQFGFILEDTPEEGAVLTVERLRKALPLGTIELVQRAGLACYPAHAFNTAELLAKAERAYLASIDWPQHRIEVASAE